MSHLHGITLTTLALLAIGSLAEEIESGIPVGGRIGLYRSTKICGNDGIGKAGHSLLYTASLAARPVAFIFAKTPDEQVASLATELDELAKTKKLHVVINFTGAPSDEYLASTIGLLARIRRFRE